MSYTDKNGRRGMIGDKWEYCGVVYTLVCDEERELIYLKHPSFAATMDDHIAFKDLVEGEII